MRHPKDDNRCHEGIEIDSTDEVTVLRLADREKFVADVPNTGDEDVSSHTERGELPLDHRREHRVKRVSRAVLEELEQGVARLDVLVEDADRVHVDLSAARQRVDPAIRPQGSFASDFDRENCQAMSGWCCALVVIASSLDATDDPLRGGHDFV